MYEWLIEDQGIWPNVIVVCAVLYKGFGEPVEYLHQASWLVFFQHITNIKKNEKNIKKRVF